jgi:hypothetical protein
MPHCDIFVGRRSLLEVVKELLKSRHPIIAFDGVAIFLSFSWYGKCQAGHFRNANLGNHPLDSTST